MSRRRLCAAVALVCGLILPWSGAQAMWERLSDAALIESSDLIVVGTLVGTANAPGSPERVVGVIEPDSVLKGDPGTESVWLAVPQPGAPVSSSDITFRIGQEGLWFLRALSPGDGAIHAADHPQRFVPIAEAAPAIDAVRRALGR